MYPFAGMDGADAEVLFHIPKNKKPSKINVLLGCGFF